MELEPSPQAAAQSRKVVALHGLSVATSGGYRLLRPRRQTILRTLNPADGRPVENEILSASVLHRDCMAVDALATALIAMGPDKARAFTINTATAALIIIRAGAEVEDFISPALAEMREPEP